MLDKVDKRIRKELEDLDNTVNPVGLIYLYRILNPTITEHMFKKKHHSIYWREGGGETTVRAQWKK